MVVVIVRLRVHVLFSALGFVSRGLLRRQV